MQMSRLGKEEESMNEVQIRELGDRFTMLDEATCEAEAIALGQQGEMGLAILRKLLASPEIDVRFWAVRGLWANGLPQAVELLIDTLQDEAEMIRSGVALALGELQAETAVDALAQLLTTDISACGDHAAHALAKLGSAAAPLLIEAMQQKAAWVRRRAAKALVAVESKAAIPVLFEALEDESYLVRQYAEEALKRMGVGEMVYFRP
jgi:HEAT repeat protein